jgi:hypothetical protein
MNQTITHQSIMLPEGDGVTFKITHQTYTDKYLDERATLWIDTGTYHRVQVSFCDPATLRALRDALNSADAIAFITAQVPVNA